MDLTKAQLLARETMNQHNLESWSLDISYQMKSTFGYCIPSKQLLKFSAVLIHINTEAEFMKIILHEIAHALRETERGLNAGRLSAGQYHDSRWKQIAASIGYSASQFYNSDMTKQDPIGHRVNTGRVQVRRWLRSCPRCKSKLEVTSKQSRSCCKKCFDETDKYYRFQYSAII